MIKLHSQRLAIKEVTLSRGPYRRWDLSFKKGGDLIGLIRWALERKEYAFFPMDSAKFGVADLQNIVAVLRSANAYAIRKEKAKT